MTPVVETSRLILRGRTLADFSAYAAIWATPEVARFTTVNPLKEEDAWVKFTRMEGLWALTGYGFWIVEEKSSGDVIGEIGLADFKRDLSPSLDGMPEYGWILAPSAQGKGYAKEAVAAALAWGEEKFPATVFSCIIDPVNAPSVHVAEAAGFKKVALSPYKGIDIAIFHRPPPG
ncbi:MAG TPA: GNAT family N-acetyltransferase [Parvularculaceae bacterium]|nr:GNAT family N-acetyltransferase [Parvularculaceae bacterium]HNS86538.1 GNAT family N-acetyltransferase [Parvularculaceae bacterium]